jgi:potassium efflux system protein
LFLTFVLAALFFVIRALLLRLLLVQRRRLAIQQARERRAAALAAAEEAKEGGDTLPVGAVATDEEVDLSQLTHQTQRIVTLLVLVAFFLGFWFVWSDVLPALSFLDQGRVWDKTVKETITTPEGDRLTREIIEHVTYFDVFLALLISLVTIIAFRNVPGLLEISVLQRLPLEPSVRYAVTSLASYVIIVLGVFIAARTVGLRWSQIQWLATALTFGLAFGLQEMFANFVAGLIILFERPLRVGDIVTVDNVTGVVSRVRIRATTITDWDRKEFVVPNKEFITGRLLNWTLSDKINRIVIQIGIAYGSDTDKARNILSDILTAHPLLMDNPGPIVTFEGFGDSALNVVVRAYLPNLDNRLSTIHELHTEIHKRFADAGIEIAFPQLDLHVRREDLPGGESR